MRRVQSSRANTGCESGQETDSFNRFSIHLAWPTMRRVSPVSYQIPLKKERINPILPVRHP